MIFNDSNSVVRSKLAILMIAVVMTVCFQNCSPIKSFNSSENVSTESASGVGNGDGYGGKLTIYHHYDSNRPCREKSVSGRPLSNEAIFMYGESRAELVRESCRDIPPKSISMGEISFASATRLTYRLRAFDFFSPGDLGLIAASCPAGYAVLAGARRTNLVASPFDLANLQDWGSLAGMVARLEGSFGGLPAYLLARTQDATNEPWLRIDQFVPLEPSKTYAVSFLGKRGSSGDVRLWMYHDQPLATEGIFVWDLLTGELKERTVTGLVDVTSTSIPFSEGRFFTVYFTTPSRMEGLDIGLSSAALGNGEAVSATSVQVEAVEGFCTR